MKIRSSLFEKGAAVVRADPGSGKSTLLPLALLDDKINQGKILLLEPRRAAAISIAARMAELLGEKTGESVGYAVRLERKISGRTRIEVLTDGLFIRRIQADAALPGVDTVIFDEFHERTAAEDLALALLLDLRRMGSKINILIMSATMDAAAIADFINRTEGRIIGREVPVFDIPGRIFPVDTSYLPLPEKEHHAKETADILAGILRESREGDTLVFLPGRREIAGTEERLLAKGLAGNFEILQLHGSLPLARQREIIVPKQGGAGIKKRRIILSTNIAESALTIPGITLVVDSGLVRLERFHVPTAMNRLSLEEASLVSAEQRTGRAGRLGPGRCIRLWDPLSPRPETTDPEIRRIDLSGLALECLLWGIRSRDDLPWLEAPPLPSWERALELIRELGAADNSLNPTAAGREIAGLGLEPRLGILCIAGMKRGVPGLACAAAAILSDRDGSMITGDGDIRSRLAMIRNNTASGSWINRVTDIKNDLLRRLRLSSGSESTWDIEEENDIGELLASAFPDRIAGRQESNLFRFASGREARIEGHLENTDWLIAAEIDAGSRSAFIRLGAPVSKETALKILETKSVTEMRVEWKGLVPYTVINRRAGRLLLREERRISSGQEAAHDLPRHVSDEGFGILPWKEGNNAARRLLERIRFYASNTGTGDVWLDEALVSNAEDWLIPFIEDPKSKEGNTVQVINSVSLMNALRSRFGWDKSEILERDVPEIFTTPKGRKKIIDYGSGSPVIRIRLQECFGISAHPHILNVPVIMHLLSPADRPIQITSDIIGFWSGSYIEVRKEMKGRYPKHNWPENPLYYT